MSGYGARAAYEFREACDYEWSPADARDILGPPFLRRGTMHGRI
jgi:hypothetical protein